MNLFSLKPSLPVAVIALAASTAGDTKVETPTGRAIIAKDTGKPMTSILLIDDEALVRETLGCMLTDAGHTVAFAVDGEDGLHKVHTLQPDLVITDLVMPGQEGIETIIAIRKAGYAMPVLAISGGSRDGVSYLKTAIALGATRILHKPFGKAIFLEMVNECLVPRLAGSSNPASDDRA